MALTHPATLATLQERVRRRLLTTTGADDNWTDDQIRDSINVYTRRVVDELFEQFEYPNLTKTVEDLVAVNRRIDLPIDFKREIWFARKIGTGNDSYREARILSPAHAPKFRALRGTSGVSGVGSTYMETWSHRPGYLRAEGDFQPGASYRLDYQFTPADMQAQTDVSEVPDEYQQVVVDGASYDLAANVQPGDQRTARLKTDYDEGIFKMRRHANNLTLSQRRRVRRTTNFGFGNRNRFKWWN